MDDNHVDDESKKKQQNNSIFTVFSILFSDKGRNGKNFVSLINAISDGEHSVGAGGNVQYAIKRFVRGLTSAQIYPRCASFAALSCFLKYEITSAEHVLDILDAEFKGNLSRSEQGALNTGSVLTCGAIIQSGIFRSLSTEVKEKVLLKLLASGKTKNYLLAITHKFLVEIISVIDEEDFCRVIWPLCKKEIRSTLADSNINSYDLLLVCHNRFPNIVDKFINKIEISFDQFLEKTVTILVNSHVAHDEPVYERVCQALVDHEKILMRVWVDIVSNVSGSKSTFKDKTIITMFYYIIQSLQEEKLVPKLLIPKFLEIIILILSFRKTKKFGENGCHALAKASLDLLVNRLTKETVSDTIRFKTIEKLMFYPANMKFEKKTGTKCIQSLIMQLNTDSLKKLADIHQKIVSGELKKIVDEEGNNEEWNNNEKQFVLHIFVKFLNHYSVKSEKEWKLKQIKFLYDTGFIKNSKLHSSVRKCARDCFYKAIEIQMPNLEDVLELLDDLIVHVNDKINSGVVELSENITLSWQKVFDTTRELSKFKNKVFTAIHLLLIHMGLQLFSDSNLAMANIDEILMCYSRLSSMQKKNKNDKRDLHWSEVTVDLMLSLLSRENKLWRYVVCNLVFPQMVKHITPSALHQIIDVLNLQSSDQLLNGDQSDGSDLEDEDEDEDDEDEDEKEEKSESSLTESENDENITVNDQLRSAVKDALGLSAALTDQESVDMDEMDEEEERKLNDRLEAAFKMFKTNAGNRNKKQTKEEKALTHFRFRVLDLVEIYVTSGPSVIGCLDLLFPLFNLLELSIKDPNQKVLHHRVDSILKKLSALKKFPDIEEITEKLILDHFEALLARKEASSLIFVEMSARISDCCTFLVRCSQSLPNTDSDIPLSANYDSLLNNFFRSRDNKLPIMLFQSVLRSSWQGNWKLVSTLYDLLADPTIKLFKKMKLIELLDIFYKNSKFHSLEHEKKLFHLSQVENKFINRFIDFLSDYQANKSTTNEKMFFAFFTKLLSLIVIVNQSVRRHRPVTKKEPQWRNLVAKLTELDILLANKKSRRQLEDLSGVFDIVLPEVVEKWTVPTNQVEETIEAGEKQAKEVPRKRKKAKHLSSEKMKLKKESHKLREAIGSNGIDMVPFSSVDIYSITDRDDADEESEPKAKRKKSAIAGVNGFGSSKRTVSELKQ